MNSLDKFTEMRTEAKREQERLLVEMMQADEKDGLYDTPEHYDNTKGSLYLFSEDQKLNSWEFDIVKRIVRCRKKGQFKEDLEKTIKVIQLYLKEYKE